ncbi:hypothetical protein ACERK3_17715 [Phycisphaerales bacterium AB-hyl4]|uniref:Uncharacterized protein n=1 Tax=Natronomicrosphaera hydrolytica TaxID=3242702 RepID=A0ABV4U9Z5_9BACT
MKIKFQRPQLIGRRSYRAGDIIEKPDAEAVRLIEAGFAVPAVEGNALETAIDPAAGQVETRTDEPEQQPEQTEPEQPAGEPEQDKPRRGRPRKQKE